MKNLKSSLLLTLYILIFAICGFSQNPVQNKTVKISEAEKQKLLMEKSRAVSMVEKTADEASLWENKRLAVTALTDSAELLWTENPAKAEKWLLKAWSLIDEAEEVPQSDSQKEFFTRSTKSALRSKVLSVAQKNKPELVEKLLKQISDEKSDDKKKGGAFDDKTARSEQLLNLAQQALETNPELAFSLAQRTLNDGISFSLQRILIDLRNKDINLANRLFDLILTRFQTTPPDTSEAETMSGYLFRQGFTFATNSQGGIILVTTGDQTEKPFIAATEPVRTKAFLTTVYQKFFARPLTTDTPEDKKQAGKILLLGRNLLQNYQTYHPELAQPVKSFLDGIGGGNNSANNSAQSNRTESNVSKLPKGATTKEYIDAKVADLLEKAEKETDPIARKLIYIEAIILLESEKYKRAIEIAEKIDDDTLKSDVISYVYFRAAASFAAKKQLETAEELIPKIEDIRRRSIAQISVARNLLSEEENKDLELAEIDYKKQRAFDLISDAEKSLRRAETSADTVKIMFGTANVLAEFDKTRTLSMVEEAIAQINKIEDFDLLNRDAPRIGIDISRRSSALLDTPRLGFGFIDTVELLVKDNFDDLATIAERFTKRETRGTARLEIAKRFFKLNKKKLIEIEKQKSIAS
ncbi:MAG: hypothetical protein M3405_07380 [Acidobacteriota bacterium]|nr:hypothetical protein [Acidobacteriota bacterium]